MQEVVLEFICATPICTGHCRWAFHVKGNHSRICELATRFEHRNKKNLHTKHKHWKKKEQTEIILKCLGAITYYTVSRWSRIPVFGGTDNVRVCGEQIFFIICVS